MPITERKTDTMGFAFRLSFKKLTFLAAFVLASSAVFFAQTIEIKLVNGRNGGPIAHTCVNVWVGNQRKEAMAIPTDESGIARLRLTNNDDVNLNNRSKECGDFGVADPVVKYDDSLRVNAGYVLCQSRTADHSWLSMTDFSTKQVLQQGIVTTNFCGSATELATPGEAVIFVRPLSWWEKLKQ